MTGKLEGRTALVTGASRGIGAAIALRLAVEGAAVAVTARTVEQGTSSLPGTLTETVGLIGEEGGRAVAIVADLADPVQREGIVAEVEDAFGPVDILVNNAAVTFFSSVEDFTAKRRQLMFEVQVNAAMDLARQVLPSMTTAGQGWILNISSRAALHPTLPPEPGRPGGGTVYGMCKAALERFSTGLASELWEANIAVNALSPNRVVPTPGAIVHHLVHPEDPTKDEPPEVMAEAALALCSRDPHSLTGRIAYSQDLLDELGLAAPAIGI